MSDNSRTEQHYIRAYADVIDAVSSVDRFVTCAQQDYIKEMEAELGADRAEQLREVARSLFRGCNVPGTPRNV